jgi:glutamate formiminotransferase
MRKVVECVPNFSEGRRKEVIAQIAEAIATVPHVHVLDVQSDADHNRTVVTFAGEPEAVEEAAFRGIKKAAELIDMNLHRGEHPRMGATDVVPFVPIRDVTMRIAWP